MIRINKKIENIKITKRKPKLRQFLFSILILLFPVQLGRHWWPQWSHILGLRVDYLSPTIYLTDLLVIGVLWLWGWEKTKNQKPKTKNTYKKLKNLIFPASVFLFLLLNCFFAQNQAAAFYKFAKIIEFTLLGLYIAKNYYPLSAIRYPLSLGVIYSSLIALAQFLKQSSLNGIFYWFGERTFDVSTPGIAKAIVGGRLFMRPYAVFPHPNALAGFILVGLILTSSSFFKKRKLLAISYQLLALSTILISFSRSVWLIGLAVGLWWLMSHFKTPRARLADQDYNDEERDAWRPPRTVGSKFRPLLQGEIRRKRLLLVACCLLLVIGFALLLFFRLPFSTDEAVVQRFDLVKVSIEMIRQYPLVGVGLNNFIVRLPDFWQEPSAIRFLQPVHNIFLLVAAETGLIGLAIFLWFLILAFKRLLEIGNWKLIIPLLAILSLGVVDHYFLTLQQTQLLLTLVLGLSWEDKFTKIKK